MFETVKKIFTDPHRDLLAQRQAELDAWERRDQEFANQIEAAETRPLRSLAEIDQAAAELKRLRDDRDRLKVNWQIRRDALESQIVAAAPPEIDAAVRRLLDQRAQTAASLKNDPVFEPTQAGAPRAFVDSNSTKVFARLRSLDDAMRRVGALRVADVADLGAALAGIENEIPPPDFGTERVEVSLSIARALQERKTA
jgi:hypothetical protein